MNTANRRRAVAQLLRGLRENLLRRPRRILLEEAEIELWRLYRREQGALIAAAARISRSERGALRRADLRAWRRAAGAHAALCAYDEFPVDAALIACVARPLHAWPEAGSLERASVRLAGRAA